MTPPSAPEARPQDPWYSAFHDLMPNRVMEILLVSSPYDAYTLEEDGRLTERIFTEYSELNLSSAPRITHVSTGAGAMELLAKRRFDLVITMARIVDTDVGAFGRKVKAAHPRMPVVLLILSETDLGLFPGGVDTAGIDHVFWWTGDARILLAIVKLVEDSLNAPDDTAKADVRVIIVVEDSIRHYSSFLSLLYAELMKQSNSLTYEGVNEHHRLMRMRARPKLLLATNYEQAMALFLRYQEHVVAVISDVRFPRAPGGEEDPHAGFRLIETIQEKQPELVVFLQSAEPANAARALELGVAYADKRSPDLLKQIGTFVTESLGFGDFIFRLPDRTEVARARDLFQLETMLRSVPDASLEYHATRNHFSVWLMARSMFELARRLRPRRMSEFGGTPNLRAYLLRVLEESRRQQQEGVITDFTSRLGGPGAHFLRLGDGSLGGKARGLGFVSSIIARNGMRNRYEGMQVRVPRSVVIPTGEFDKFMESNRILEGGLARTDAKTVLGRCLSGELSDALRLRDLQQAVAGMKGPLAVRSSSLLEDSQLQAFAGIYATYMLPNNHPDPEVRFRELCQAIKAVYASTYSDDARAYIAGTPYSIEEEKMAVLIQEIVGRPRGRRFYPHASGVAVSYNYYPVGNQRAEDGLAMVALGLGQTIVQGGLTVQFSPSAPELLPQFGSSRDYLQFSQSKFYALDLARDRVNFLEDDADSLTAYDLRAAEEDGTLALVGSVYSRDDDSIRDNLKLPGTRLVTFHNLLKYAAIPLAPALAELLKLFTVGLGGAVEVEFALDGGDWGNPSPRGEPELPTLYVLQVRPQATQAVDSSVDTEGFADDEVVCRTDRSLGHGVMDGITDIVFVPRENLASHETAAVAEQVGQVNARLQAEKRPYLLVGPGRWGSSDSRLGIPVKWAQIAGAKVIVETNFNDREVEPSQGTHFFHNVTQFRIGYLTLSHVDRQATAHRRLLDVAWLERQPTFFSTPEVRHIRLDAPLRVRLDGRKSTAVILKPAPTLEDEVLRNDWELSIP